MKSILFTILFSLALGADYAQTAKNESEKIATFCKVWGFLKYFHPAIATGKIDWDKEFTERLNTIAALRSKKEINNYYSTWINGLGSVDVCEKCENEIIEGLRFNLDLEWLKDSSIFSDQVINQLQFILQNRNQGNNHYVQINPQVGNVKFTNEKKYEDSVFPSAELRVLGLARYWNSINYFYPYKYKTDQNWQDVLTEMVPKFRDAPDTVSYHLALRELIAKIDDSHAGLVTHYTNQYFGYKWAPFQFKIIDDKAVVTDFYNDSLCKKDDIRTGDVFLKVDGVMISEIITKQSKYVSASNRATLLRNLFYAIFNGQTDSVRVVFERNGLISEKTIHRYIFSTFKYDWAEKKSETWKILDGNIGYVNMGALQPKQIERCLSALQQTKAIIFDVRNYPNGTMYKIANFLNPEKKAFAMFTEVDPKYPGVFHFASPYYCGKKNKHSYIGKVVLLFDEHTQSHAEFTLMALETAPNVVKIGSQTAGADGNVSQFIFPGNYTTYFTGIGVYYPNGKETQRIGIVPDIEVKQTIQGIREGRDEVLEKAIETINRL